MRVFPLLTSLLILFSSTLLATPVQLPVCYNFGCKQQGQVPLSSAQQQALDGLFHDNTSAQAERRSIQRAIARLESYAALTLPTGNDVGNNYKEGMAEEGQMDCIDESTNTTTYLRFLESRGLLKWHSVEPRVYRAPYFFDSHWGALIRERQTGTLYVVDSWFYDNGHAPVIQLLADWKRKRDYQEPPSTFTDKSLVRATTD